MFERITPQRFMIWMSFATAAGAAFGILGPFGSYLNGDVLGRVAYWVMMCWIGCFCLAPGLALAVRLGARFGWPRRFSVAAGTLVIAAPLAGCAKLFGHLIWPRYTADVTLLEWYGESLFVTALFLICGLLLERAALRPRPEGPAADAAPSPILDGAPLCLQMEDHYVRIHRDHGSELLLMTLKQAITDRTDGLGLQVHRSWWVAAKAVKAVERDGRNWQIRLANGMMVPVARNRVAELRAAGWIVE